jgi:2-polyprenyl-6-methoxyphenol hydroxylase-like FAD-dependent oxidoreductase
VGGSRRPIRHETSIESVIGTVSARVRLSDGFVAEYDVVVGADGIHSSVRRLVFGGHHAVRVFR